MSVSIKLPDGSVREYAEGSSIDDVAASISSTAQKCSSGEIERYRCRFIYSP